MLLVVGIAVPIAEEIFFRGVVYRWLRDKWGVAAGAIVSGIIFGLAHLEPATVIVTILLGIVLALVYERSRSLWPPILIHALNNSFAVLLLYILVTTGAPIPGVTR
ncbi:MAG: CPBP family intramembrane glutamic endopeptidase [Anaerolineae bacterium]|nr:CPBP family intramembrane metalloprotease [Candidatus Roseilinea sp.]MDW8450815.1 CPBP family intramembrane glutamic endopeptidase [Anaerolineae bacterium]